MMTREVYVEKLKARLNLWDAELGRIDAKAHAAQADVRIELERIADELHRKRDEASRRMRKLEKAGEDSWDELKSGTESAFVALGKAFERTRERLGE
jgi:hypothetical protein